MNKWYLEVRKLLREIHKKAFDARLGRLLFSEEA